MKKLLHILLLLLAITLLASPAAASEAEEGQVYLDGIRIATSHNGLLPIRDIAEQAGGTTTWNQSAQTATIRHQNNTIILTIGQRNAIINGRERRLAAAPVMIGGRTMVTPCFIADHLNLGTGQINNITILTTAHATRIPVLTYHHILPDSVNETRRNCTWTISRNNFTAQMQYLHENSFYTPSIDEFEAFIHRGRPLPNNSVIIHFDDGYYSNYVYAAPILRQYGLRAVMFAITSDVEHLGEIQPPIDHRRLTRSAASTLRNNLDVFETASHTHAMHDHAPGTRQTLLVTASREEIIADTLRSFEFVANHRAFAYPHGQYNATVIQALQEAGITIAFTTTAGYVTRQSDPMRLERFTINRETTIQRFRNIVNGRG